jgi:asparagine N-glycosylation enzyme membrane subunit Stt3
LENPVWGIGAGKATEYRFEKVNDLVASHSEITRMLAEHGAFGVLILLLLITTPLLLYLGNKQHIFLLSFLLFWILTINHAAMRIAAPSFIYALSLLKVRFENEEDTIHRQ